MGPLPGKHLAIEQHATRMRQQLQESGPAYSCFALYLASRPDALPAEYCREFAITPDSAPVLPPAQVRGILDQELGAQFDRSFAEFNFAPLQSNLITQSHQARLRTGVEVQVLLLRPYFYGWQERTTSEFPNVHEIKAFCDDFLLYDAITDFTAALRRKTDLAVTRQALELLARDGASFESLHSPRTFLELSTRRMLTIESLPGPSLLSQHANNATGNLARRLCHAWLHQAVRGRCFPADLWMQNIYLQEGNRVSFLNCEFVGLPSSARENLFAYLGSLMRNDPDAAATHLLQEMEPPRTGRKIDAEMFRTHFRQAAYFGMLEPILGTDSNALAQIVFQHWKTALEHGYSPRPHLLCFYRGLFSLARVAKQLSPDADALREGMEEFQATNIFGQVRELLDWRYWHKNADKFASAMVHLPGTLDEALNSASALPLEHVTQPPSPREPSRGSHSSADFIMLLVLLVLILQLPAVSGWSGKITPIVLMLAGLLVLLRKH